MTPPNLYEFQCSSCDARFRSITHPKPKIRCPWCNNVDQPKILVTTTETRPQHELKIVPKYPQKG